MVPPGWDAWPSLRSWFPRTADSRVMACRPYHTLLGETLHHEEGTMMARLHIRPASDRAQVCPHKGFGSSCSRSSSFFSRAAIFNLHPSHALFLHGSLDQPLRHHGRLFLSGLPGDRTVARIQHGLVSLIEAEWICPQGFNITPWRLAT